VAGHGHGKAPGANGAAGGFAALLLSLGSDELPPDARALAGDEGLLAQDQPEGAARLAEPALALPEPQALLPDGGINGVALPVAVVVPALVDAGGLPAAAADALARLMPQAADTPAAAQRADVTRTGPAAMSPEGEPDVALAQEAVLAPEGAATTQAAGDVQPLLRQAALAQRLAQQRGQAAEVAAQGAKEQRGQDIAARLGWQVGEPTPVGGLAPLLSGGAIGEAGLRPFERRGEKAGTRGALPEAGAWNAAAHAEGLRLEVPAAAPDAGLMTEMRVAEQVSYWVGRGVQNAELELEGLGEGAVQVSIALQGQEARVEFRADQVQTRQVLEDSMPHLRELLAREGLVLSGVSVGASGSDSAAGRPSQEGRRGERQTGIVAAPELPPAAAGAARAGGLTGRSVDLFV
jgi:flagellar hook-length control protein FliK